MNIEEIPINRIEIPFWSIKYDLDTILKEKLKISIKKFGYGFIYIRENEEKYEILDGRKRFQCIKELQIKTVLCTNYGELSDLDSLILIRILNHQWSTINYIALSEYLNIVTNKKNIPSIANYFPETKNEVEHLFNLLNFNWSQFDKKQIEGFLGI